MNVQFRCGEPFLPGYFDRIYIIFRLLIAFFSYPVNPVDPVKVLRSVCKAYYRFSTCKGISDILNIPHF